MSKPPKQSHIDYLLDTIAKDHNPSISQYGNLCKELQQGFIGGQITEQEVRLTLGTIKKLVVEQVREKSHAEKLFTATIEYIINPALKVSVRN